MENLFERQKRLVESNISASYGQIELMKAIEGEELAKGKKANLGEIREWGGKKYQKTTQGWIEMKDGGKENKSGKEIKIGTELTWQGRPAKVVGGMKGDWSIRTTHENGEPHFIYGNSEEDIKNHFSSKSDSKQESPKAEEKGKNEDYKIGDIISFKNGEDWIVVKTGIRRSDERKASDEVTVKPHNKLAKERNVSLSIDLTMDFIEKNKIDSKQ